MRLIPRIALLTPALVIGVLALLAEPDGGKVQFQNVAGSFIITLFTDPTPLRIGAADLSVMIQNRETHDPVLNGRVQLSLHGPNGRSVKVEATHRQAQNKLLYAAMVRLPESGRWQVDIHVSKGEVSSSTNGEITILKARSSLVTYWDYLLIPLIAIALFILHQWLKR
jgi:hypothetical protein